MANAETQWAPLEHLTYQNFRKHQIQESSCLLAISGGLDSMALLQVLSRLQAALKLKISVFYGHHGPAETEQQHYRDQAQIWVETEAKKRGLAFFTSKSPQPLSSEREMRDFRRSEIQKIQLENSIDWIVWAHHRDDFMETQMLRLIRGAGKEALFQPMSFRKASELRPFLACSKQDLKNYLQAQQINWLEDPSNQNENYLRNWLRNNWLPQLEAKCPGALNSLSRSLGLLQETYDPQFPQGIWTENGISRPLFLTLNAAQKKQCLALYLRGLGQREFSHNQLNEILKQLDNSQLIHTFKSAQMIWSLSKELIYAKAPFVVNAN